jgi:hypothetical protein
MTHRYTTLAALKAAYDSGELSKADDPLWLDNDTTFIYVGDDEDAQECVYKEHPGQILSEALDLLGIPHDYV